ncbi:hypothetical protein NEUTE2DRAFT_31507, partial [Neurospora tetrasperma FGSC 2509]
PLFKKILNRLLLVKIFIKLDLKDIYYRIWIREGNKEKIVFYIKYRYYKFLIILIKLVN